MTATVRSLLVMGNDKLGLSIAHFDLPAVRTCPGRSRLCVTHCYATRNRFRYPQVRDRLNWDYAMSKRADFADRLVAELYRKGVLAMRWHVAGDFYSPAYARKALEVVGRSPHTSFWAYTRSWRVPAIYPLLQALSLMPNMRLWLSADAETGYPPEVPRHARVAWMQTEADEDAAGADLVFRLSGLRRRVSLSLLAPVCPTETPEGRARGVSCATCGVCWK